MDAHKPYPEHIDSGVKWLGQIPAAWSVTQIKRLARPGYKSFTDGDWVESPYITQEGVRLLQTGNIGVGTYREQGYRYIDEESFGKLRCTEVEPGDILICRLADPVGRACLAPDLGVRMITSVDVCILKLASEFDPRYIVYFLSSARYLDWLQSLCRGGTRDRLSRSMLGAVHIAVPPLPDQRAIATFLDRETARIDALVAKKQRLIELLQEKRTSLIAEVVTRGLVPSAEMNDSSIPSIGMIPAHWSVEKNRRIYREVSERSTTGEEELLTVSHITGVTPRAEKQEVNMFMAESLEGYKRCHPHDLVINTMWAWMGALGITRYDGIVSPSYNVYRLRRAYDTEYLDRLYRTPPYISEINRYSKGVWTSRLRLYPQAFFEMYTLTPPLEEQQAIAGYIREKTGQFDAFFTRLRESIEVLQEYRTALITAAVTGQIDVRDAVPAA